MPKAFELMVMGLATFKLLSGAGAHNPTAPNAAEIATSSALVPPGGTAQVRFTLTQPRPIMSTGTSVALDGFAIDGIALWSPNGEACGVGSVQNGVLSFSAVDASGILGGVPDYPFLTVTLTAPSTAKTGSSFPINWSPDAWLSGASGPYDLTVKPGKIGIFGNTSIQGIYPGGGTYPAGTLIRIPGSGFQKGLRLQTPVKYSSIAITPNEIQLTLKEQTTMDSQSFQVTNPDGSSATYFAYLRGKMLRAPSQALLRTAEYAFPLQAHSLASVAASDQLPSSQWRAVALQNPNPGPAAVTVELEPGGQGRTALFVLPPGTRMVDTISGLLNGYPVQPGDTVRITSTAVIQMFGITGDESAHTLKPFPLTF